MRRHTLRRVTPYALLALTVAACGGDGGPSEPQTVAPTVTIVGVADGETYSEPVTVDIDVSPASATYSATLNGATIWSGHTVSAPGDYVLDVVARNGLETANETVAFSLVEDGEDLGSVLTVHVLDLGDNDAGGGGDAILLTDSSTFGKLHALVDAGPSGVGGADEAYVSRRLVELGVDSLEAVILTHAHTDHFEGLPDVLTAVPVDRFLYNGQQRSFAAYSDLIALARSRAGAVEIPTALTTVDLATTTLTVVPPLDTYLPVYDGPSNGESAAYNEGSVGALVERGTFDMFLTGDGEVAANERWRTVFADLTTGVEVLKAGHHGANDAIFDNGFSGSSTWLEHTDPETIVISANGTSHPRHNALTKILERTSTRTYCTHVHGDITLRVTGAGTYTVEVERNAEFDCVAGSEATS